MDGLMEDGWINGQMNKTMKNQLSPSRYKSQRQMNEIDPDISFSKAAPKMRQNEQDDENRQANFTDLHAYCLMASSGFPCFPEPVLTS